MITPGSLIDDRYQIVAALGAGGMGQVYRAARPLLGDEVAIKVMHAAADAPTEHKERFLRESRSCAQLRHPNIVTILDFSIDSNGRPFLVMELLSGPSLREEIELSGAMSPDRVVEVLTPVAAALQLAHDRGITHRDLKPANIVSHRYETGERVYKIIDFGLAAVKEATDETRLTSPAIFLGTLAYAAPEQLRGEPIDERADIYALGVIAYEMLTGKRPLDSDHRVTASSDALTVRTGAPGEHRSGLPTAINDVIMRALAKEPGERWLSVNEFMRALQVAVGTSPARVIARPEDSLLTRYDLGRMVGRGRMGSLVYIATHRALSVPVAIRVLRRDEEPHWEAVKARFLVEARTLQVSHPNLLQVRDFGEDERLVYVVTDYVEGLSLRQVLATDGKIGWVRAREFFRQMLEAASALNARGGFIVGVNPDMIRVTFENQAERVVLSAAGIRSVQDVLATMREQELRGEEANEQELPYIAPEVLLGRAPEPASDVFTAGVLLYEMLTATLPYRARTLPELIGQMLQSTPADVRSINPEVPESAAALIAHCLQADPKQRTASARVVLACLQPVTPD